MELSKEEIEMKTFIFLLFLSIASCSSQPNQENLDVIDKLVLIHKTHEKKNLISLFGNPDKIKHLKDEFRDQYIYFAPNSTHPLIQTSIDTRSSKILSSVLYFSNPGDDYAYLKEKFKTHKWVETELAPPANSDVAIEMFKVEVKELGISFEYDNQDPQRRVLWIFFE